MRKFYVFVLAALMVLGIGAVVYADDGVPETYGGYQVVTETNSGNFSNGSVVVSAACPDTSWRITGGGFTVLGTSGFDVIDNRDIDGGTDPDSWHVTVVDGNAPASASVTVRAICTKLG